MDGRGLWSPALVNATNRSTNASNGGDSLRAIARDLHLSRGTVNRFARAADATELLFAATHRPTLIDDYRLCLHHRWMEGCTNASALAREIQQLGYRGDVNTVRRHLKPYRNGTIPQTAPCLT